MKHLFFFIGITLSVISCTAQTGYERYFKAKYEISDTAEYDDLDGNLIKRVFKAFTKEKPLAWDLQYVSYFYYKKGNHSKGQKYLLEAAGKGLEIEHLFPQEYFDSILYDNPSLQLKFEKKYNAFLKNADIVNSLKITRLFVNDQNIREYDHEFPKSDTSFLKSIRRIGRSVDSINCYTLLNIMAQERFDSKYLTLDAKDGLFIILTHASTYDFVKPDSVFSLLRKEIVKGSLDPRKYANCVDRYYMSEKGMNYYCNFYDPDLPIYDIKNVDKRRAEVFLYPLYFKFKMNHKLDKLPKEYKYDIGTIK